MHFASSTTHAKCSYILQHLFVLRCIVRCAAKMAAAHRTTSFDRLSVGQPPALSKPETEVDSAPTSDDRRRATSEPGESRRRRPRHGATSRVGARGRRQAAETTSFVGMMQQLSVDGHELFELAERGHFDVVDATASKDVGGGPVTFTSTDAYLSLSVDTQSPSFSIYFRVTSVARRFHPMYENYYSHL